MNATIQEIVNGKSEALKRRHDELMADQVAAQDRLAGVNKALADVEAQQADIEEFLTANPAK